MNSFTPSNFTVQRSMTVALLVLGGVLAPDQVDALPVAVVLDFNEVIVPSGAIHLPPEYGGFRFQNTDWYFLSSPPSAASTNTYLALSGKATAIIAVDGADFLFDGADIWSRRSADANGSFYFILYHDGVTVYDGREDKDGRLRFTGVAQHFVPAYSGPVDGVAMVFTQSGDDWNHLAMDNFQFRMEPPPARPVVTRVAAVSGGMRIEIIGDPRRSYTLQVRAELEHGEWNPTETVVADNFGTVRFGNRVPSPGAQFFRVISP